MRKQKFLILCVLLLTFGFAAAEENYLPLPDCLAIGQHTVQTQHTKNAEEIRTYPDSRNEAVNAFLRLEIDRMAQDMYGRMMALPKRTEAIADTGASITVTGRRTASFLVLSHLINNNEQVGVDFATFVFDMETGERLPLSAFLTPNAEEFLRGLIWAQLNGYFPDLPAADKDLDRLTCDIFAIPYTLTPAQLVFHFRADALYHGKNTLMHVSVPYMDLVPYMTDLMRTETDNSMYRTIAMTFDDGPARRVTKDMLLALRDAGVPATFFNLGDRILKNADYIAWEHDAGHAVDSHTYQHDYVGKLTETQIKKYRDKFNALQISVVGIPPRMMRAPGGNDKLYAKYGVDMPIIRWNTLSGDAGKKANVSSSMATFIHTLKDHSISLMHNLYRESVSIASAAAKRLRERGYLFVTVEDFLLLKGIRPENNVVYFGDEEPVR